MLRELRLKSGIREDETTATNGDSCAVEATSNGHGHASERSHSLNVANSSSGSGSGTRDTSVASYSRSIIPRSSRVLSAYNSARSAGSTPTGSGAGAGADTDADSVIDALAKKYSHIRRVPQQPPSAMRATTAEARKETTAKARANVTFSVATSLAVANAAVADAPPTLIDLERNGKAPVVVNNGGSTHDTTLTMDGTLTEKSAASEAIELIENEPDAAGRYANWTSQHATLASSAWCCIGDLISFCDRYEFKALGLHNNQAHQAIVKAVKALLAGLGPAPFDLRRRFPANIRSPENLWMCIDRCPSVEYHLKRILSVFRRPLPTLSVDKQRAAVQTFHLAVNELRLDISARITEVRLYDRLVFERDFNLQWEEVDEAVKEAKRR